MNLSVLNAISYGVYAIGVQTPDKRPSASIVNTLVQVATTPACVCVCINRNNFTNECIKANGWFSVSVFNENATLAQIGALGFSSGRDHDKLAGLSHRIDADGLPILSESISTWFKCRVTATIETVTHTLFVAEVVETADAINGKPMTYSYYHTVVKGKVPPSAPHVNSEERNGSMDIYTCDICGYEYDGDISFDELGDDYVCPVCGAGKEMFVIK